MSEKKTLKVVVTGAESTGKSTLTKQLAAHYKEAFIDELARDYVECLGRAYTYEDVEIIAHLQLAEEEKIEPSVSIVFIDTWLLITKVWFDFVYGKHPQWLEDALRESKIDLFLLCDIDLPWEKDSVRENGGENRKKLHEIYKQELHQYGFNYKLISGKEEKRTEQAIKAVDEFLRKI